MSDAPHEHSPKDIGGPTIEWHLTRAEIAAASRHVTLNADRIDALLEWLEPATPTTAWRTYIGPVDTKDPDLSRIFFELAITISQFGGFVGFTSDGGTATWKHDGSGVKAILATLATLRANRTMPGIDVFDNLRCRLAPYFIATPFAAERIAILEELAAPRARFVLDALLARCRQTDGAFRFDALHMLALVHCLPKSFGGDAPIHKKASLLLMTMEIALRQLGCAAYAHTPPPADYRLPQILEGVGVLRLAPRLARRIDDGHLFRPTDPSVRAVRTMTVVAVTRLKHRLSEHMGSPMSMADLDARLYLLSRDPNLMQRHCMRPHMRVATMAF